MRSWASEFKQFLLRGNVIDLAVAFVIGAAFAALVQAAVADLLTPLVAAIFGQPDFGDLTFTINGSVFKYGHFLNVADLLRHHRLGGVLLRGQAHQPADGDVPAPRVPRPQHPQVPGVRQRDPH